MVIGNFNEVEIILTDFEALVLLNMIDCLGSIRVKRLLEYFKKPSAIFEAEDAQLRAAGSLTPLMSRRILEAPRRFQTAQEIEEAQEKGIKIVTFLDAQYPKFLREIYDPPIVLYVLGEILSSDENAIGVVGSRGASYYGLSCAKTFSTYLAHCGLTIVSGLARGIDTASHRACLDAGGRTLAVVGSGLNNIYPPENKDLFHQIVEQGAVISQFPLNTAPLARNFPIRNRIISGLSLGVLVVEANEKSGALITARYALEQDREVFAIPGKVSEATSSGTNSLIKQGAKMVTAPQEILVELRCNFLVSGAPVSETPIQRFENLNSEEEKVFKKLSDEPLALDTLILETGLNSSSLLLILTQLELKKIVTQLPGKNFVKTI